MSVAARAPAQPPARAGVRGDPRDARGRGRTRASGAAVQRRQGLDRAAAPGREGVPAGAVPVPADARRHRAQLPRGDRVPRPPRGGARRAADRRQRAGVDRQRPGGRGDRAARLAQPAADGHAARRDRRARLRRGLRRRAPRRGARAGEGAVFSFRDDFGQWDPKSQRPELWNLYNGRIKQGRERARVPDLQLDRARRVGVHRPRGAGGPLDLLRPRARGVRARRDAVRVARGRRADRRRAGLLRDRPLPHRRRHELHRRRALAGGDARGGRHARSPRRGSPSAARRAPTTASPRPRWRTARRPDTSDASDASCREPPVA